MSSASDRFLRLGALFVFALGTALSAHATLIDFETVGPDSTTIPNGYSGFNWSNFAVSDNRDASSSGGFSGNFTAFTGSQIVSVSGFRNWALVGVQSVGINAAAPRAVSFTFTSPVDTLAFGSGTVPFVVDDLNIAPVPEPASFAALSIGALAFLRRRRPA